MVQDEISYCQVRVVKCMMRRVLWSIISIYVIWVVIRIFVKCWDSNSMGDEGGSQGRIGVNSDGFLRHWAKGASTPDLMVTEFWMACGQMDLASACVLRPLNHLVLYFKVGGVTGRTSGGLEYTGLELAEGVTVRGGVEWVMLMVSSNYGTGLRRVT